VGPPRREGHGSVRVHVQEPLKKHAPKLSDDSFVYRPPILFLQKHNEDNTTRFDSTRSDSTRSDSTRFDSTRLDLTNKDETPICRSNRRGDPDPKSRGHSQKYIADGGNMDPDIQGHLSLPCAGRMGSHTVPIRSTRGSALSSVPTADSMGIPLISLKIPSLLSPWPSSTASLVGSKRISVLQ